MSNRIFFSETLVSSTLLTFSISRGNHMIVFNCIPCCNSRWWQCLQTLPPLAKGYARETSNNDKPFITYEQYLSKMVLHICDSNCT